jgi:hypothetical protein
MGSTNVGTERGTVTVDAFTNTSQGPGPEEVDLVLDKLHFDTHSVQRDILHEHHRLMLIAGGERAGKSWVSGLFGTTRTMYGDLFWIIGPDYALARPEFHYWTENLMRLGAIRSDRDVSMPKVGPASAVTKTGQRIETKTSDDVHKLAAYAPSGIVIAEAAQQSYEVFLRSIGRVAETRGWVLMSGTFESSLDWYADKFNEWKDPNNPDGGISYSMPSWNNSFIYPGGREDPEILRLERIYERVPGMFDERLGAVPVPPAFLVFREFRHSMHVHPSIKYDPSLPVYLAVDPASGTNPYSILAVQFRKHEREELHPDPIDYCNVIDEVYLSGRIGEAMIEICKDRVWWSSVRGGAIDVEAPDEKKRWLKYGKVRLHSEKVHQLAGIRRLKSFLYYRRDEEGTLIEPPHLMLSPKVKSLPYEFSKYRRPEAPDDDHRPRDLLPKNLPDHSIKALWYLLIARYGEVKASRIARPAYTYKRRYVR